MWKIAVADTAEDHLTLLKDALKAYFQETHRVFSVTSYTDLTFLENEIEQAKSEIIQALNDKADLTARQQHYETMLEQVNLRRSEVSQKLLRFKSDESVQDEKILQEKAALDQVQEQLEKAQFSAEEAEEGMNRQQW